MRIDKYTIIARNFNTYLSITDGTIRYKINKNRKDCNTIDQLYMIEFLEYSIQITNFNQIDTECLII